MFSFSLSPPVLMSHKSGILKAFIPFFSLTNFIKVIIVTEMLTGMKLDFKLYFGPSSMFASVFMNVTGFVYNPSIHCSRVVCFLVSIRGQKEQFVI